MPNQHTTDVAFKIVSENPYDTFEEAASEGGVAVARGEHYFAAKKVE